MPRMSDGSGQPPELPRMGAGGKGPPVGTLMRRPRTTERLVQELAIDADVRRVVNIFRRADYGQTWDLYDLYDDGLSRDSRLDSVSRKRVLGIQSRPMLIEPMSALKTDREAKRIAANVKIILDESPQFTRGVAALAAGVLSSLGVCEIDWRLDARGWIVPALDWRHSNLFGYSEELDLGFRLGQSSLGIAPLSDYPDKFVVHTPMGGRASYPWRLGALRTRILPSMVKRNGVRWWAVMLERWGQPQVYANQSDGDVNGEEIKAALKELSEYWQAVFPAGVTPQTIPMSGQINSDAHAKFIELANTDDAIALLGQNLTTEVTGGSFAATEAHRFVADDILRADLVELSETITQQLVEPIVRYNWPGAPVPRARFVAERAVAWTVEDVNAGLCTDDEFRQSKGAEAKPDGAGGKYRTPSVQVPQAYGFVPAPTASPVTAPEVAAQGSPLAPSSPTRAASTLNASATSAPSRHPLATALSKP